MKQQTLAAAAALLIGLGSAQAETLKMATIEPSLGQAITMATFANLVTDALGDIEIEVAGGGAATVHMLEVGRGNLDMSMVSPTIYRLMQNGKAMYAKEPEAPELSKNVQLLMWFPYGQYHYTVRAGSDIETCWTTSKGASVFLGPARAAAPTTPPRHGSRRPPALLPARTTRPSPPTGRPGTSPSRTARSTCIRQWLHRSVPAVHPVHRNRGYPFHRP
jgi:TRAP-type uncharacterized transport system substrate-binding protein